MKCNATLDDDVGVDLGRFTGELQRIADECSATQLKISGV